MMKTENKIRIGITHGDINGIGYEVIFKTFLDNRTIEDYIPIIYGSPKVAAYHRKNLKIQSINLNNIRKAEEAVSKKVNIINCADEEVKVELGRSTPMAGEASFLALERAVEDIKSNKIDILITAPINKYSIHSDKFPFQGHTEYLKSKFNVPDVLMLMVSDILKVGLATTHLPLKEVAHKLTQENLLAKLSLLNDCLQKDFAINKPRIALLGLNPHAGENSFLGKEEEEIITPAINKAREKNIMAFGPYAADGFFGSSGYSKFDAVLAMYHDQGLAPFKALAFEDGVNFTAGLPIVRTSPAHGTAYELAGKGEASPDSFRHSLYLAIDIFNNRRNHKELTKNPLQTYTVSDNQE